jgi:hypothetical protein
MENIAFSSQGCPGLYLGKPEGIGFGTVVSTLHHSLARLTAEEQEADHRRHAGQLNWQHAQDYFHDCDPKYNTPKHRFGMSRAGSVELAGLFSFDSGGVPRLQRRSKLVSDWFCRLSLF